jgi:hypothetical protein
VGQPESEQRALYRDMTLRNYTNATSLGKASRVLYGSQLLSSEALGILIALRFNDSVREV